MILELLRWWYGPGWRLAFQRIGVRTHNVAMAFSVPTLLKTLFAPWRRIVTVGGKSIDAKMQAAVDNLVSRLVGFVSRCMVLLTALIMTVGTFLVGSLIAIAWPLLPVAIVICILKGTIL